MRRCGVGWVGVLVGLVGCQTPEPEVVVVSEPPQIPIESAANTRIAETQKAYAINRYVDPGDRRAMHERHVVYRVEEDAKWRLASNVKQQILIGNTLGQGDVAYQPQRQRQESTGKPGADQGAASRGELDSAISQMKVQSRNLLNENLVLSEAINELRSELAGLRELRAEVGEIAKAREAALAQFAEAAGKVKTRDGEVSSAADVLLSEGLLTPEERAKLDGLEIDRAPQVTAPVADPAMIGEGF